MAIENRFASESYVSEALESYLQADDLDDYAKLNDLNDYAKLDALNDYSKLSDLNDYAKLDTLNDYATTEYVDAEVERVLSLTERVKSWGAVQYYVRNGQAPYIFNIGDQLVCNSEQFGELVWDIIGFDQDTPTDNQYTHSMTLQLHNVLDKINREFDAREALYCTDTELVAGTYYLSYNVKVDGSGTQYYVTMVIPEGTTIPADSVLYGNISSASFYSRDLAENYGTVTLSQSTTQPGEDVTYLGETLWYNGSTTSGGFNSYKESNIRFFLNGDGETLNWTPQSSTDIAPSYVNNPGFLYQIDEDFKEVLGSVNKLVFNSRTGLVEEISDLVFLPSITEIYGLPRYNWLGETVSLGDPYEYYILNSSLGEASNSADTARIKYNTDNVASAYYIRTPFGSNANAAIMGSALTRMYAVPTAGSITSAYTVNSDTAARYLAPCCCVV